MNGEWHTLLKKVIITVVNKYDTLDDELREEYLPHLTEELERYLAEKMTTLPE